MSNPMFDMNSLLNSYRLSLEPVAKAQAEALKIFETFARYQLSLAGDCIDWSVSQAKAFTEVKTSADFVAQQSELSTRAGEQFRKRGQELSQIATETQGTVKQWMSDAGVKFAEAVNKAA